MNTEDVLGSIFYGAILIGLFVLIAAWPVMVLWNWLMPYIFELPALTFWKAFCLSVLCNLLFGSHASKSKE